MKVVGRKMKRYSRGAGCDDGRLPFVIVGFWQKIRCAGTVAEEPGMRKHQGYDAVA
jgi:hypothetical protein